MVSLQGLRRALLIQMWISFEHTRLTDPAGPRCAHVLRMTRILEMLLLSGPLQTVVFPEPDRIDPDESRGVAGVVVALHIHADQLLVVQGFGRLSSNDVHLTLKDRQLHATLHVLLRFINAVTDELTLRTVPEPVIDELGELDPETLFDLPNLSVHREGLDVQMSVKQDGSSRGFVDT